MDWLSMPLYIDTGQEHTRTYPVIYCVTVWTKRRHHSIPFGSLPVQDDGRRDKESRGLLKADLDLIAIQSLTEVCFTLVPSSAGDLRRIQW